MKDHAEQSEAIRDREDALSEKLLVYRANYAYDLWNDESAMESAISEALATDPDKYMPELKLGICPNMTVFIFAYFDKLAEQQYQSEDDI